jgi:uncharacterized damage-inducible protein DinB
MDVKQRDLHQQLRAEAIATRERIAKLVRPLDLSKINEHPEPEGWSVGQVLEHLVTADELYEAPFAELMRTARPDAGARVEVIIHRGNDRGRSAQTKAAQASKGIRARSDAAKWNSGNAAHTRDEFRKGDGRHFVV